VHLWQDGTIGNSDPTVSPITLKMMNYPNPFNPSTTINYSLKNHGSVTLRVYNMLGQQVSTLVNEEQQAGPHSVNFDASRLSSGVYFYSIESGSFRASKKMILMK